MTFSRSFLIVILGNILEYYDFLLFAHLASYITPLFFEHLSPAKSHLLGLLLTGLPFVLRPLGGYFFGRMSDLKGRRVALITSVKWAIFPSLAMALLPLPTYMGALSAFLFVAFRLFQGFALGGEYPVAGTYLSEQYAHRRGFISGILVASGTIGSLLGFGFSLLCLQEGMPSWLWRVGFLIGGVAGFLAYRGRVYLLNQHQETNRISTKEVHQSAYAIAMVLSIGALVGVTVWIPMVYTNYYVTKVMGMPTYMGYYASCIALVSYIILNVLSGWFSDRFNHLTLLKITSLLTIPLCIGGVACILQGYIFWGQILLISASAAFGAYVHPVMNDLFPAHIRSRRVSLLWMSGLAIGGLSPFVNGWLVDLTDIQWMPALLITAVALLTFSILSGWKGETTFTRKLTDAGTA